MNTKKFFFALSLFGMLNLAQAENIQFQNIRVGGTGCPSDVTSIVTAPDLSAASLIFQSFESHVPAVSVKGSPTTIHNLNCNMFLDIKVPVNQKLDSLEITYDMRGHASLDQGVAGSFRSFMVQANGIGLERNGRNQLLADKLWQNTGIFQDEDFIISTTKILALNSQCGGSQGNLASIHLQHQLGTQIIRSVGSNVEGTITVDTSDLRGGIRLRAITSPCGGGRIDQGPGPGPRPPGPGRNCRFVRINNRSVMVCD